ncbi:MAG: aspartate/glutamate racemase family protein [Candidatus Paceibacterota bacterium]
MIHSDQNQKPLLGFFDSGVGGFSVLKEVKTATTADVLYFGDCARAPYGNRSLEEIVQFMREIILHLKESNVTHFVSACNSMSVHMTEKLLRECDVDHHHYIDIIIAFKKYCDVPNDSRILVIGTQATITSQIYQTHLRGTVAAVFEYAPRTLAGSIESNIDEESLYAEILPVVIYAKEVGATHLLYGCTHYPLVHNVFVRAATTAGWEGKYIDPALYVAQAVSEWGLEGEGKAAFETSKDTEVFTKFASEYR